MNSLKHILTAIFFIILSCVSVYAADVNLSENLATVLPSAKINDSSGQVITATNNGGGQVSLSANISEVYSIDFSDVNLSVITASSDFESFDVFTSLNTLIIPLPENFSGDFVLSFDSLKELDLTGSTANFSLDVTSASKIVKLSAYECPNLNNINLTTLTKLETLDIHDSATKTTGELYMPYMGDSLKWLDMHGFGNSSGDANIILDISNQKNLVSVDAHNCPSLVAVNLGMLYPAQANPILALLGMADSGGTGEVATSPLESLTNLDLSNNPRLNRVGYVLSSDSSESSESSSGGGIPGLGGGSTSPKGYRAHTVITTVIGGTEYETSDLIYPSGESSGGFSLTDLLGGTGSNDVYRGEDVNLLPAIKNFNLKDSGIDSNDYISIIHVKDLNSMISADFSGMDKLQYVILPEGENLINLDLTGDISILSLDLSYTLGFLFPAGFETLTGLEYFYMMDREDLVSIDISNFAKLIEFDVTNSALESLDLTSNQALNNLYAANNNIYELDLSGQRDLLNIDLRNNMLAKIALSQNIRAHVNSNSTSNSVIALSPQKRFMTQERSKFFDFKTLGLTLLDISNIEAESIKGDGVNAINFDQRTGIAEFDGAPVVINYKYNSGIYYEANSDPLCMSVRLTWDLSDTGEPILAPTDITIYKQLGTGKIIPVVIKSYSNSAVTWTMTPNEIPAGLSVLSNDNTFIISGEPLEIFSGIVEVIASNNSGDSEPAVIEFEITSGDINSKNNDSINGEPVLTPANITLMTKITSDSISPIVIIADSDSAVTWRLSSALPAGLKATSDDSMLVIYGTPSEIFSGNIEIVATNDKGDSKPSIIHFEITLPDNDDSKPVDEKNKPVLTPTDITISKVLRTGEITPVVIRAISDTAVKWILTPDTLPEGLYILSDDEYLTINGEPLEIFSGTVNVIARNENGDSDPARVQIEIMSGNTYYSSGGGGCDSGMNNLLTLLILAILLLIKTRKF